jgi:hypothetical protein
MAVGTKNSVIQRCGAHHIAVQTRDWDASLTLEPRDVSLGSMNATIAFFKGPSGEVIEFFETH